MKVVFVCNELPPASAGGIGPAVATLARGLAAAGHQVSVLGTYEQAHDWNLPGVRVIPILDAYRTWKRPFVRRHDLRRRAIHRRLRQLRETEGIEVVEWPDYEGLFLEPIPGVTDVLRNHGPRLSHRLAGLVPESPYWEQLELRMLRTLPNWIGVSQWFMDEWLRIAEAKPLRRTVVYNPVDVELFHPEPDPAQVDPNLVLYAGSFFQRKGVLSLLKAANLFLRRCPHARLVLTGRDLTGFPKLEAELDDAIRNRVTFAYPMPQPRLAQLIRRAAVFAMPSVLESFGNVWAEAMASGVPVVGSVLSCGPEVVPDGVAGLLTNPEDPATIADAVEGLLRDPVRRQKMGRAGREIAEARFSLTVGVERTVKFYEVCQRQAPVPPELERLPGAAA